MGTVPISRSTSAEAEGGSGRNRGQSPSSLLPHRAVSMSSSAATAALAGEGTVPYFAAGAGLALGRPNLAVKVAEPSLLAWVMKPIIAAVASGGTSSFSTFSA